jgi:hypothetical protein
MFSLLSDFSRHSLITFSASADLRMFTFSLPLCRVLKYSTHLYSSRASYSPRRPTSSGSLNSDSRKAKSAFMSLKASLNSFISVLRIYNRRGMPLRRKPCRGRRVSPDYMFWRKEDSREEKFCLAGLRRTGIPEGLRFLLQCGDYV